jgi:hypothetical protein
MNAGMLFSALIVGSIGLGIFMYGRRQHRIPHLAAGIGLMVFPYALTSTLWILVISAGIIVALYLATWLGL